MKTTPLDSPCIRLEAYEPAGTAVEITPRDLLGHTLVLGGSGAGKTTCVIQPMVEQLMRSEATKGGSVVILDTKADGEAHDFVRESAFHAERENGVSVVAEDSGHCLDLLQPLKEEGLEGASKLAGNLNHLIPECPSNRYWEVTFDALLRHTCRLFLLLEQPIEYNEFATFVADYLLRCGNDDGGFKDLDTTLQYRNEDGGIPVPDGAIHEARSMHRMWERLDWRARSVLQSMAAPLVALLNTAAAKRIFSEGAPASVGQCVETGGILLVSADAVREPGVSRLAGTLLKSRFYEAILKRRADRRNPISTLVLDDWIQSASHGTGTRHSDADALALIRSRHGCVIAAAQGLAGLDLAIGPYSRRAVMANFANLFFFRSRDADLDSMAAAYLGQTTQTLKDSARFERMSPSQRRTLPVEYLREIPVPAVLPGALARLPTGEGYALIGGRAYSQPIAFIPHYTKQTEQKNT